MCSHLQILRLSSREPHILRKNDWKEERDRVGRSAESTIMCQLLCLIYPNSWLLKKYSSAFEVRSDLQEDQSKAPNLWVISRSSPFLDAELFRLSIVPITVDSSK